MQHSHTAQPGRSRSPFRRLSPFFQYPLLPNSFLNTFSCLFASVSIQELAAKFQFSDITCNIHFLPGVCMCICMYARVCIYTGRAYVCEFTHVYSHICVCLYMRVTCACVYMCAHLYVYVCAFIHVNMRVCIHVCFLPHLHRETSRSQCLFPSDLSNPKVWGKYD